MLGLAAGIWGVANDRLTVAGIGLGLAATLKLSPIILIVYLCFRGRRRVVVPAAVTAAALAGIAMLLGRPSAVFEWLVNVVPKLAGGTARHAEPVASGVARPGVDRERRLAHQEPTRGIADAGATARSGSGFRPLASLSRSACGRAARTRGPDRGAAARRSALVGPLLRLGSHPDRVGMQRRSVVCGLSAAADDGRHAARRCAPRAQPSSPGAPTRSDRLELGPPREPAARIRSLHSCC